MPRRWRSRSACSAHKPSAQVSTEQGFEQIGILGGGIGGQIALGETHQAVTGMFVAEIKTTPREWQMRNDGVRQLNEDVVRASPRVELLAQMRGGTGPGRSTFDPVQQGT